VTVHEQPQVGIVGAAGRGGALASALAANGADIRAVCDVRGDSLDDHARHTGASEAYTDYAEMLDRSQLDAVVIGTPMHLHVSQTLMALERGVHVLCEVPAAVSVDECRQLVSACRRSRATYMMAENANYMRSGVIVAEIARQGLLGEVYYTEAEYLHELKDLVERTTWRRKWQVGIDGITYGTHSLGPILQCMPGDRIARVCCEGSGHHYRDPRGNDYAQDTSVMLCKTARGGLAKVRMDLLSNRPHAMMVLQVQGTEGAYESARGSREGRDSMWFRALSEEMRWHDLDTIADRYLPQQFRDSAEEAATHGHGGADYFMARDFVRTLRAEIPCPIGVHEAMDMTLPGLISQQSIAQDGAWLAVPDSRKWTDDEPREQLRMVWPEELLCSAPEPRLPDGYELRLYRDTDEAAWIELMAGAGFDGWYHDRLERTIHTILPDGFFLVEHRPSGRVVATAMATHHPAPGHPFGGELGWVAGDSEHSGKGLGLVVCAAVTARFIAAGYRNIYLRTDDFRLPAIKTYLKLGYQPLLFSDDMAERWRNVYARLNWAGPVASP